MNETITGKQAADVESADHLLVAGIGASAGGIPAIKRLLGAARPGSGVAYVVIVHLSPEHESNLVAVLQSASAIPVVAVNDRMRVEADRAYVVPPKGKLAMVDGHIAVEPMSSPDDRRVPIDLFFRTLAESHHAYAASIVLSGTGADGSMGMKRVKENGGLCIAQAPSDAEFRDMPTNAIATSLVDYVVPAAAVPERLVAYRRHLQLSASRPTEEGEAREQALVDIFTHLRVRTGHDFSSYKRSTVLRRVERRMGVNELDKLGDYARLLRENRTEAHALLKDLLISVTNFFRDPDSCAALAAHVMPRMFAGKGPSDHVRVWVPGCATGEEAYSIAMMLAEQVVDPGSAPTVQVFATDIDEQALAKARAGLYTANDTVDVSPERLRRFFVADGDAFRVRRELREMVLFAAHNVIKDPPFSHLDLVSCRNLLIYLNRSAQQRVLKLFHFALTGRGFLFLGNSESAEEIGNMFVAVDKDHHIFESRGVQNEQSVPLVSASLTPMVQAPVEDRGPETRLRERVSFQELHQRLLEQYAPPSLIVNRDFEVLHLSERAGRYLQFVGGEPSQNLLKVVRPELRLELHSALYQAVQNRGLADVVVGPVSIDGQAETIKLTVSPVFSEMDPSRGMMLVIFQPLRKEDAARVARPEGAATMEPIARQLEEELVRVKLQLRTTIEQHELQHEELRASNEELQAMNEELRSSSEELETSKEELQSVNEELTTVNQELKIKIDELSQANNDTRNLMNSTDLATVFVDRAMRIKLFTPRARSLFNLIPGDAGRPLLDITHRLQFPEMVGDIERVLDTLAVAEREVQSTDQHWYIARVLPYRTAEDRIAGVVLTFTDITERKRAEEAVREREEMLQLVASSVLEYAIFTLDLDGRIRTWNLGAHEVFGYTEQEAVGQYCSFLFTAEDRAAGVPEAEMTQARELGRAQDERWHLRKDGKRFFMSGVMAALRRGSRLVGYAKIGRDLTAREESDQILADAREKLEARVLERTAELATANETLRRDAIQRTASEEERVRLLRQLVNVQEEERGRISRELHDQLGQEVTAIGLQLAAVRQAPELAPATRMQIDAVVDVVKQLDTDVEFLVWELRPTALTELGLREALADYAASWSRHSGIRATCRSTIRERLAPDTETALYRIAQEALNNIAKHSQAATVDIALEREGTHVILTIRDDGRGFDAAAASDGKSLGLVSMRERAALVAGDCVLESHPGRGTTVTVRVPA